MPITAPYAAQFVGVAASVLPDANCVRPELPSNVLQIAVEIFENDHVVSDARRKLHLLFLDGSTLTVGYNSDEVVGRFI